MCVDTNQYKCCNCCSLTTATLVLGALYLLSCIGNAVSSMWLGFAISLIISLLFVMVLVKPNAVYIRKLLFYLVSVMSAIQFLGVIIVFIYLLATDDWIEDACLDGTSNLSDYNDCLDYAKTYMVITFIFLLIIYALLVFCTVQILYYGWKEQAHLAQEAQAAVAPGQAQPYMNAPPAQNYAQ